MQKTKKQLLGFAGLAAVGIMTAVAYAMPAAAAEDVLPSSSDGVNVQVQVLKGVSLAHIVSPANGATLTSLETEIVYSWEESSAVEVIVDRINADGTTTNVLSETQSHDPTSYGTASVPITLSDYEADYKVTVKSYDAYGKFSSEDTTTFSYRAVSAEFKKTPASNGDPIIDIEVNSEVAQVAVNVYNKAGDPLFVDKDGKEVPIVLSRDDIDPVTGKITKILPFADYNAANGPYTAVVIARNAAGNYISMVTLDTVYTLVKPVDPNLPDTPNTGFTIGDLNISRVDYLITGLIVFGVVSMFALYLVYRKSRR